MNIILNLFLIVILLILIILVAALFAKKEFIVHRELIINSPKQDVFDYIKFLQNHKTFSKWSTKDMNKKTVLAGIDGNAGFIQSWNNYQERAGEGELEIKKIIEGSAIELEHRYLRPIRGRANTSITIEPVLHNQAKVKWAYQGFSNYPMNLLTAVMNMDKIVGKDLENCLVKLKSVMEQ